MTNEYNRLCEKAIKEYRELYRAGKNSEALYRKNIENIEEEHFDTPIKEERKKEIVQRLNLIEKRTNPRVLQKITQKMIHDSDLEPLKTVGKKITGNLFDRVEFLKRKIEEIKQLLEKREQLHTKLISEIEADIEEREKIVAKISDIDRIREHKLDINLLKMEKRKEEMLFWRDVLTLRKELQDLTEQHENELKIANLFGELNLPK